MTDKTENPEQPSQDPAHAAPSAPQTPAPVEAKSEAPSKRKRGGQPGPRAPRAAKAKAAPVVAKAAPPAEVEGDPAELSENEKDRIRSEVRRMLRAEKHKTAMQRFREEEEARLRIEEGMVTGTEEDQLVNVTLDLAKHSDRILVNLRPYYHGHTYPVPVHVARSLLETQYNGHRHQNEVDGKNRYDFYASQRLTELTPHGVRNAPLRPDAPVAIR